MKLRNVLILLVLQMNLRTIVGKSSQSGHKREKRFLVYPTNSAIGILCAIAVPLDIPHRNVFMSYNFEGNYNMPTTVTDIIPGPLNRLELVNYRGFGQKNEADDLLSVTETYNRTVIEENARQFKKMENSTVTERTILKSSKVTKSPHKRYVSNSLFTRKKIYKMLEGKLRSHGHFGKPCLLRAICEEAEEPIHDHNGVLGDIIHIILTPSTSIREDLHPEYYKAEELGRSGECSKYKKYCPCNILDYISKVIEL
ncbi:uncharacterized protein DMENIID0001_030400 [Sergentomyia squamirostris]